MLDTELLRFLEENRAIIHNKHFVYTSGNHGTSYIDMRTVAHRAQDMSKIGRVLGATLLVGGYDVDLVIGPETLGRTLAAHAAEHTKSGAVVWCDMSEKDGRKVASFPPKLKEFPKLVYNKRLAIVDDLLTTGTSIHAVADLVRRYSGDPVVAAAAVRRSPSVTAQDCGVGSLEVLADVEGFKVFSEEECAISGPCAAEAPVVLRPGHGHKWIEEHPNYPTE